MFLILFDGSNLVRCVLPHHPVDGLAPAVQIFVLGVVVCVADGNDALILGEKCLGDINQPAARVEPLDTTSHHEWQRASRAYEF